MKCGGSLPDYLADLGKMLYCSVCFSPISTLAAPVSVFVHNNMHLWPEAVCFRSA